jgi:hypothetical protein
MSMLPRNRLLLFTLPAAALLLALSPLVQAAGEYRYPRADFGQRIEGISGDVQVWWCEATWKVAQQRPAPQNAASAATLSAARNDFEAVQVVLRPPKGLRQLTAAASAFEGADGAVIPARNVQVLRVYYHFVQRPTDRTGTRDWWPDALPPLDKPLDLAAEKNQPLWVLVHVPQDAKAGDYKGTLTLKADDWSAAVPLQLHVWNFALPKQNHLESGFGLGLEEKYHHLKTDADKRRMWDMYFQAFADHRISPYDPTPMDPIRMKFLFHANPPRAEIDFTAFDRAMRRGIDQFHFTNLRLGVDGVGGSLRDAQGNVFHAGSPEFEAVFASEVKQLQDHFREQGWLKAPYVYWTDEPKPQDYPHVQAGMDRIKKYAPDLPTLITLNQPDELLTLNRSIDIWCPNTPRFNPASAEKHRAKGERYWWYLCTGPKAPFVTLFIDHPATEMRVWAWQTWQRDIAGLLVWATTYWNTHGNRPQNPYEDPMSYSHERGYPYYGNGDGRLLYPPLAAARPDSADHGPIMEPPVSCIRLEMLREGIEDYEFLWLLRDLIGKKRESLTAEQVKAYEALLQVPDEITASMTKFTIDPQPIYARRAAIAEAIERLMK